MSAGEERLVVLVDEHPERARGVAAAIERSGCVVDFVSRPEQAAEAVRRNGVAAVLLRLEEDAGGIEGLRALSDAIARGVPVIAVAAEESRPMRRRALAAGARDFVATPDDDHEELVLRLGNALELRDIHHALEDEIADLRARLVAEAREVGEVRAELEESRAETLRRLALASEYRDDATYEHPQRVARTAALIAQEMSVDPGELGVLRQAAELHDVGKIGVPDAIMLKPGPLDEDEFELMKTHAIIGWQILAGSPAHRLSVAAEVARSHHERFDGSGYPDGLAGDAIPLTARITALADTFDALTHLRPYRAAFPVERAVEEVRRLSRSQFDPRVVGAFELLDHAALLSPVGD